MTKMTPLVRRLSPTKTQKHELCETFQSHQTMGQCSHCTSLYINGKVGNVNELKDESGQVFCCLDSEDNGCEQWPSSVKTRKCHLGLRIS